MARARRDFAREYARRVARARERGFESPYVETYANAVNRYLRERREAEERGERYERPHPPTPAQKRRLKRHVILGPRGWWTLPIWIYRCTTEPFEVELRLETQIPISPVTGAPFRRWIPVPPTGDCELAREDFTDPQEADTYCVTAGTPVLWWLWPKQLNAAASAAI